MSSILVVDDEKSLREFLTIMLEGEGYEVVTSGNGEDAVQIIRENSFDLIITDIRMRRSNGIDVLEAARKLQPTVPVVMMTAYASAETAVEAMKKGAYDYISKPFKIEDLQLIVKNAVEKKKLSDENLYLKSELKHKYAFEKIIGKSPVIQRVFDVMGKIAGSNATVLITGESGTGKELAARAIHYQGARKNYPFVSINCGALPETLLESELFGHEKGAFTSADSAKVGLMETAQKGSFFLDEIGEAPISTQVKLLRVLQEREFTRIGGIKPIHVDLRYIAASNQDLAEAVREKRFREDLYYRLNVIHLHLPALRERKEDIPLLLEFFLNKYKEVHHDGKRIKGICPEAVKVLERYDWPGNIRELENVIERAVVLESGEFIHEENLPEEILEKTRIAPCLEFRKSSRDMDFEKTLNQFEKDMIVDALCKSNGDLGATADRLGVNERSLRYRMQKYGLQCEDKPEPESGSLRVLWEVHTSELESAMDDLEKKMILLALNETNGVISRAAAHLNLSFRSLRYRLQKHNIQQKFDVSE